MSVLFSALQASGCEFVLDDARPSGFIVSTDAGPLHIVVNPGRIDDIWWAFMRFESCAAAETVFGKLPYYCPLPQDSPSSTPSPSGKWNHYADTEEEVVAIAMRKLARVCSTQPTTTSQ